MYSDLIEIAKFVERDAVKDCVFPNDEVLPDDEEARKNRASSIHKATSLGNLEQQKVQIIFKDAEGLKRIHTTIWAQTGTKIILKDNLHLPVHRILAIQF